MKTDRFLFAKLALVLLPILLTFGTKGAIAGMEFTQKPPYDHPIVNPPIVNPPIVPTNVLRNEDLIRSIICGLGILPRVNQPRQLFHIIKSSFLNSVGMRQEVLKLKPIVDPSSNVLCSAKGSADSIKQSSNTSSQNDPYKGIPACADQ